MGISPLLREHLITAFIRMVETEKLESYFGEPGGTTRAKKILNRFAFFVDARGVSLSIMEGPRGRILPTNIYRETGYLIRALEQERCSGSTRDILDRAFEWLDKWNVSMKIGPANTSPPAEREKRIISFPGR